MTFKDAYGRINTLVRYTDLRLYVDNTFLLTGILVQKTKNGDPIHSAILQSVEAPKSIMQVSLENVYENEQIKAERNLSNGI